MIDYPFCASYQLRVCSAREMVYRLPDQTTQVAWNNRGERKDTEEKKENSRTAEAASTTQQTLPCATSARAHLLFLEFAFFGNDATPHAEAADRVSTSQLIAVPQAPVTPSSDSSKGGFQSCNPPVPPRMSTGRDICTRIYSGNTNGLSS